MPLKNLPWNPLNKKSDWHPFSLGGYGVAFWMVALGRYLVWLETWCRFEGGSLFYTGSRCSLFELPSLPQFVRQVSPQTAQPPSNPSDQRPRFAICWGQFPRPSDPFCRHLCSAAVVCLWGSFPALVLHRGDPLGSGHRPDPYTTWPSLRRRLCFSRVYMLGVPARSTKRVD